MFPHLLNAAINDFNNNNDIKYKKEDLKEHGLKPAEFFQAMKEIIEEKENKKFESAEIIEELKPNKKAEDIVTGGLLEKYKKIISEK